METSQTEISIVGYQVKNHAPHLRGVLGIAQINGESVEHLLSNSTKPEVFCDMGRNADGDVVWISSPDSLRNNAEPQLFSLISSSTEVSYDSAETDVSHSSRVITHSAEVVYSMWEKLKRHRTIVLFASGVTTVLLLGGLLLPASGSTPSQVKLETYSTPTTSTHRDMPAQNAAEAAIDFVVTGKVSGATLPAGVGVNNLSATVVSTSGEIVLVDVQANQPEGLTTFATLLLQKSGTAWRIREVFDPR